MTTIETMSGDVIPGMADPLNTLENVCGAVALLRIPNAWPATSADGSARAAAAMRESLDSPGTTELDISGCGLTALPPELGQLKKLEVLFCDHNQLTALPVELGRLEALEWLDCSHNQLTALPAELGQLEKLEELNCGGNQLTTLPSELGQLEKLRELYCSNNPLGKPFCDLLDNTPNTSQEDILAHLRKEALSSSRRVKAAKIAAPGR